MSAGFRWLLITGAGICGLLTAGMMTICFASPHWQRGLPFFTVLALPFCLGGWYCLAAARRAKDVFELDEAGITRVSPDGSRFQLLWSDITAVVPREKMARLDVFDRSARPVIRLEYQLNDFDLLRSILYEKTHALLDGQLLSNVFSRSTFFYFSWCFLIGAGFIMTWAAFRNNQILGWFLAVLNGFVLFEFLKQPRRLEIAHPGIRLSSFLRTREIPYSAIRTVEMKNVQTEKGDSLACVSLVLKDDSEMALTQFRQGSLALYHALQKSLDKYSATGVR
jgi:hypothetical protein